MNVCEKDLKTKERLSKHKKRKTLKYHKNVNTMKIRKEEYGKR